MDITRNKIELIYLNEKEKEFKEKLEAELENIIENEEIEIKDIISFLQMLQNYKTIKKIKKERE